MAKEEVNIPITGMTDVHPLNVKENQYPFMLNGNVMTDISSATTLTNEHSNYLCNNLPEGFKVIGTLFSPDDKVVYLWLVNPDTGESQVGYLGEFSLLDAQDQFVDNPCDDCVKKKDEATPLEQTTQLELCVYTPIVTDGPCALNFSIDFPIRKGVLKKDNCGDSIYFTDFHNPPRVFRLKPGTHLPDDTQRYITGYLGTCNGVEDTPTDAECHELADPNVICECCAPVYDVDPTHVDCDKIRLFPVTDHICVQPATGGVVPGGTLKAGVYQLAACYADQNGQRATRAFSVSNPVSVFDPNQTITDQTDYSTDLAIKFLIKDLNPVAYQFIDVFVIATINNVSTVKRFDAVDITTLVDGTLEYTVSDFEKGKPATIDDVFQIFVVYELAQEIASAGNCLLLGNLTGPRDLNLQRAVNGLSSAIRWVSSEANEDFYADGANCALYRGYLRDEVYPLGIVFERNNTLDTCAFPLIGREVNTALTAVQPDDDACLANWIVDIPGFTNDTDAIGTALFSYVGEWIPTRLYRTRIFTTGVPYEIVVHNGVYYIALADNLNSEPPSVDWEIFDMGDPCNLCVNDLEVINNDDVFQQPGCDPRTGGGVTPNKRWEVYNTACNSGEICSPLKATLQCVDHTELVKCHSFRYEVQVEAVYLADYVDTTTTLTFSNAHPTPNDPVVLGIQPGMLVTGPGIPPGTVVVGPVVSGSTITLSNPVTSTEVGATVTFSTADCPDIADCDADTVCHPTDCYLDNDNRCIPCVDNYTHPLTDVNHFGAWNILTVYAAGQTVSYLGFNYISLTNANVGHTPDSDPANWQPLGKNQSCPAWPPIVNGQPTSEGCNPSGDPTNPFVRTRQDAIDYFNANGSYLLCIDATLAGLSNLLAEPYAVKTASEPVKILDAITKDWYVYNIVGGATPPAAGSIQNLIITTVDPTPDFQNGTKGPTDPVCIQSLFRVTPAGQPLPDYLFPGVNMPDQDPENYDPTNAIASFNPSPEGKCNDYGPTAPLMYMLGYDLTTPGADPCGGCADCTFIADYWGLGTEPTPVGEVDNAKYQSYWYSFTATALQPTIIIKSKIFYKFGEFVGAGHTPDNSTAGSKDYEEQGDFRIDVFEGSPLLANPTYSTGKDSVNPATYYYDNTTPEQDWGVLVIGDVANSSGQATTAGQLPLTVGQTYYVHIYMLPQGITKLEKAPIPNPNKPSDCVGYDADSGSCCPCYFANYAWMNLCMNSAVSNETKTVSLPETWEVECEYELHFRQNEVVDHGCMIQTFEYGPFAFTQALTKTYPNNKAVWGDLCTKPIRHFRFPDCLVSHLQDRDPLIPIDPNTGLPSADGPFNSQRMAKIYPLGFRVDPEDVKAWLKWAVLEGLITEEERLSITGYKLVRGNRVGNKSIAAKGMLYDMWKYNEHDYVNNAFSNINSYYKSYPFNDFRDDQYLNRNGSAFKHPFSGTGNKRFSFVSPETTFNSPFIGDELKFEAVNFGDALGNFYMVSDHPKYVLLSSGGIALASALAAIQLSGDLLVALGQLLGQFQVGFANTIPVGSIVGFVGAFLDLAPKFFIYAKEWRDIILNFGVPKNFAKYYAAVGNYHSSGELGEVLNSGNKRRLVRNSTYLLAGNLGTSDDGVLSKINNYEREDSVYLFLNKKVNYANTTLLDSFLKDTSRFIMSDNTDNKGCSLIDRQSNVASYYASIKYYVPDQYGSIQDIQWLYTGACVPVKWEDDQSPVACTPIFGGDTFIARMSQKGKLPFFLDNPVGVVTGVEFQYQHLSTITDATYFFNSVGESTANSSSIQFKPVEHKFDCTPVDSKGNPKTPLYLDGSMYLFSYGISSFICETDINLNYRYAENTKDKDFYPHQSDIENWTQEYLIPIETPNAYLYNRTYTKQNKENFFCTQPVIYNNDYCITTYRNRVISSIPDTDPDFFRDNWKIFLGGDYKDFPLYFGLLNGLDGLERDKVMLRFSSTTLILNASYKMDTEAGTVLLGTGSLFEQKPEQDIKATVGHGGTQSHAFVSTPQGHFWVDTEKHKVFMLSPRTGKTADIPVAISDAYDTFFITNLPFFILNDFPEVNVDNNYKDIGMAMDWDYRFGRLFLTKIDYQLLPKWKGQVTYVDNGSGRGGDFFLGNIQIALTDTDYFCNKSWTISFSPGLKSWISFYSFVPNYYIAHAKYLQTGVNYVRPGADQVGVWNHFISNKSYQVFYGTLYPFISDVIVQEQLYNRQLHTIEYQADFLRFQNDYDYFYNPGVTFNKMAIWSENQNSGNLELVPREQNNFSQNIIYPRINPDSTSVLIARTENNWAVNQFFDLVANKYNNVPPMLLGCSPYLKQVNPDAMNYNKPTFQRQHMTSDYFTLRFNNDKYSNYKIINKWFMNKTIKSYS